MSDGLSDLRRGGGPAEILLVDDEEDILPEYAEFLTHRGMTVQISSDPEQAAQLALSRSEISVVVTDLRMAKLDGAMLIRRVREGLPAERTIGFIIVTGDAGAKLSSRHLCESILLKPVDPEALFDAINLTINKKF